MTAHAHSFGYYLTPGGTERRCSCGHRAPDRIQLSRAKGWRKPEGAVVVSRPTKWGNPYQLTDYRFANADGSPAPWDENAAREMALRDFQAALWVGNLRVSVEDVQRELRGKVLGCWCSLGKKCHADVLIEVANA